MATLGLAGAQSTAAATSTLTFAPAADTYVASAAPTTNYGAAAGLEVDNSPVKHILLKFTVAGVGQRQVTSARLRLHAIDPSPLGGQLYLVSSSWSESSVSWNSAPATGATPVATLGGVAAGFWYEIDLSSIITGDGTYSLRITSTASDGADYASKERPGELAPQLVVAASDGLPAPIVIVGAGDIADGGAGDTRTAALLDAISPTVVFTTGDNAYENGTLSEYQNHYAPTWGRHKTITRPTPGNHEYHTPGATGYYDYFGSAAGDRTKGYYSYDLGTWHLIALNSNCAAIGGCGSGSPQHTWLVSDLAATTTNCIAAYWHHPRFSSGNYGNDATFHPFWQALYDAGADIVMNGHDHNYQRYAPLTPQGTVDDVRGIREFVVGTGGRTRYPVSQPGPSTREAASSDTYGALKLTLASGSYSWEFVPEAGGTFTDSGGDSCARTASDTTPPTVSATTPPAGASGVAGSISPTASFSEAMNPATLTTSTFTLVQQGQTTPVPASVGYASQVATLDPSANLAASTTYTATVKGGSSGAKDVAGNALASDVSWSFTTAAAGSGTSSYLSDLAWMSTTNGWGPVERDRSNGEAAAGDGSTLTLNGVTYAKGLGAHATSDVRYALPAGCTRFKATVGVDDEVGGNGSVTFEVYAGTTKIYDSGVMSGTSPTKLVDVGITGASQLRLVITNGGNNINYDHGDWADARIEC